MIYADYTAPVQELREELHRILETTELWDKKTWALQVTDATERTIQIRTLMSARNGPAAFDLRCYVRERLVQFLRDKYPLALPKRRENRLRAELDGRFPRLRILLLGPNPELNSRQVRIP